MPDRRENFEKWSYIIDNLKLGVFPGENPGLFSRLFFKPTPDDSIKDDKDMIQKMMKKNPNDRPKISDVKRQIVIKLDILLEPIIMSK